MIMLHSHIEHKERIEKAEENERLQKEKEEKEKIEAEEKAEREKRKVEEEAQQEKGEAMGKNNGGENPIESVAHDKIGALDDSSLDQVSPVILMLKFCQLYEFAHACIISLDLCFFM